MLDIRLPKLAKFIKSEVLFSLNQDEFYDYSFGNK